MTYLLQIGLGVINMSSLAMGEMGPGFAPAYKPALGKHKRE